MQTQTKQIGNCLAIAVVLICLQGSSSSQIPGEISIQAAVARTFQMTAGQISTSGSEAGVTTRKVSENQFEIQIAPAATVQIAKIVIPITMRTNAPFYRIGLQTSVTVAASMGSPRASGDGAFVMPDAISSFVSSEVIFRKEVVIAAGSRISRRGNGLTPSNAITSDLTLSFRDLREKCPLSCSISVSMSD